MLFDGANEMTWKHGSKEMNDHVARLPSALKKIHQEIQGNQLAHLFEFFMNENSSLVQSTGNTFYLGPPQTL